MRYRAKHPEKVKATQDAWKVKNKEKIQAQQRAWTENNRGKVRLYTRMANARRRSNGLRNPTAVVADLQNRQKGMCAICSVRLKGKFHIDHIMPLARGGENLPRNLQLLCVPCNLSKRDKHPVDFMQSKGFLI